MRYPDPKQIKLGATNRRVVLPKLGWLRYRNSGGVLGALCNVTVSASGGKWFVAMQTAREVERPIPGATSAIGIRRQPGIESLGCNARKLPKLITSRSPCLISLDACSGAKSRARNAAGWLERGVRRQAWREGIPPELATPR